MASVMEHVESAAKTGIVAALTAAGILTTAYKMRAFWSDDESALGEEDLLYPVVVLEASPSTNMGANARGTLSNTQHAVPMTITVGTDNIADPKRASLLAMYNAVRGAVDSRDFTADFTTIGSSLTFDAILVNSGSIGVQTYSDIDQWVSLETIWKVCGVTA